MATADKKPQCKFGENCYRKNPQHLKQYRHPKRKLEEDEDASVKKTKIETEGKKAKKIEDFFGKKAAPKVEQEHTLSDNDDDDVNAPNNDEHKEAEASTSSEPDEGNESNESEQNSDEETEVPDSPVDIRENIKQKFLVEMPDDFYHFWDFCKSEKPSSPECALDKLLGFKLVGPFDILAGKHKGVTLNKFNKRPNFLLHWRYYFDPPEFQTVIKGDDETQFHLGYFRDDPEELPSFVAVNSAKVSCSITAKGDNLFAAVNHVSQGGDAAVLITSSECSHFLPTRLKKNILDQTSFYVEEKRKSKDTESSEKSKLKELSDRLKTCAEKHGHCMDMKSKRMRERDKKVVCKSFHGAGIVVPVDENEVGYREVPETPADLKKMFKKIADSKTESERDKNYEDLQELVTLVQFANDECDYGEGLELGMDLFCYGGDVFKTTVLQLLPLAYMLLGRTAFQKIIEAHMKQRRKDLNLSQLD